MVAETETVAELFFDNSDFRCNSDLRLEVLELGGASIVFVDNVFARPDRVVAYLNSIKAIKSHKSVAGSRNGIDFLDGQHLVQVSSDPHRDKIEEAIASHFGQEFAPRTQLTFNQFRLIAPPQPGRHWWPHVDDQVNQVTFLNPDHHGKGGTSIYRPYRPVPAGEHEHTHPWRSPEEFQEILCVRDLFNMLVAFSGQWYHGMKIHDDTFAKATRYTEVRFI
jgi:hypothetical protein